MTTARRRSPTHPLPAPPRTLPAARSAVRCGAPGAQSTAATGARAEPAAAAARCAASGGHLVSGPRPPRPARPAPLPLRLPPHARTPAPPYPPPPIATATLRCHHCSALDKVQPRAVSYEEQVGALREQLAALYERREEWSKAAQALAGIDLDSGMRLLDAGGWAAGGDLEGGGGGGAEGAVCCAVILHSV